MQMNIRQNRTRSLVYGAIIAATYVALVFLLAPISYGAIQIRVADALVGIVPLVGWPGVVGVTIGVLIGNIPSTLGPLDLLSAIPTFVALVIVVKLRDRSVMAGLTAYTAIISAWVGYLLALVFQLPFAITFVYLFIGIGIATMGMGYLLYKAMKRVLGNGA
jgi:uncharacterized membrane protein